jgi:hypothetical protein
MSIAGDDGGINGSMQGGASNTAGANDSRIYADGINMDGGTAAAAEYAGGRCAGVVIGRGGRSGEAETAGVVNASRRLDGFSGSSISVAQRRAGPATTSAQGCGPAGAVRAAQRTTPLCVGPISGTSWGLPVFGSRRGSGPCGNVLEQERRQFHAWTVDFDRPSRRSTTA